MSGAADMDEEVRRCLSAVQLLSLDVDGVQTDGGVYVDEDGQVSRKFHVHDGVGIQRVRKAGIEIAMISAGSSGSIEHRASRLGVTHVFTGVEDKLATLRTLAEKLGIPMENIAHVGDDLNDLPVLEAIGCPMTVADGMPEVIAVARYVTTRRGGDAAVREVCDLILRARESC